MVTQTHLAADDGGPDLALHGDVDAQVLLLCVAHCCNQLCYGLAFFRLCDGEVRLLQHSNQNIHITVL
jgi:hypothetical protein